MPEFSLSEREESGVRVIAVHGELDIDTAPRLRETLERAAGDRTQPLVIDLSECGFVDSTGLAAILHGTKPLQNGESNVALVAAENSVRDLLHLSAIDQTIPVFATWREAVEAALASD